MRLRWHAAVLRQRLRSRPVVGAILLYHRVAEGFDPLLLNVSPARFAEQLEVVAALGTPALLGELRDGRREKPRLALTFDDGYRDNLTVAEPMLARANVPATVFVTTGPVDGSRELWWDAAVRRLLSPEARAADPEWNIQRDDNPTPAHASLRVALRERAPAGGAGGEPEHPLLSPDEVALLARSPLVEIGGHTVTHPVLARLSAPEQEREIRAGRARLAELTGVLPNTFAYPYGTPLDYDRASVRAVVDAGFELACANVECAVGVRSPRFELPRLVVRDWPAEELERRLARLLGARLS